ncbi:MAG: peptide deformylase [Bacillota bacterium]|nr:peptide deformylase [Bacillota bacterium]
MAIRQIITEGDPVLRKTAREVKEIDARTEQIITDLTDTLASSGNGIGLAAPQVGVLRRIFVIDMQDGTGTRVFINPRIVETEGSQCGTEGCLSLPGLWGEVERPARLVVEALDRGGESFRLEADGLLAVCVAHENDHLDGVLFRDRAEGPLRREVEK